VYLRKHFEIQTMEDRYRLDSFIEEQTSDIIDEILILSEKQIRKNWLQEQVIPTTVDAAMKKIEKIIAWATVSYDGKVSLENPLESSIPDKEPSPASIDTWARGSGKFN